VFGARESVLNKHLWNSNFQAVREKTIVAELEAPIGFVDDCYSSKTNWSKYWKSYRAG
jgi:hypothetical protein